MHHLIHNQLRHLVLEEPELVLVLQELELQEQVLVELKQIHLLPWEACQEWEWEEWVEWEAWVEWEVWVEWVVEWEEWASQILK